MRSESPSLQAFPTVASLLPCHTLSANSMGWVWVEVWAGEVGGQNGHRETDCDSMREGEDARHARRRARIVFADRRREVLDSEIQAQSQDALAGPRTLSHHRPCPGAREGR